MVFPNDAGTGLTPHSEIIVLATTAPILPVGSGDLENLQSLLAA
jgi:hypothetical protein